MDGEVYMGHHCPKCNTTVGMMVVTGGKAKCPGCGGPLQAAPGGPNVKNAANVQCKHCGASIGMMTVVGGTPTCPSCGKEL